VNSSAVDVGDEPPGVVTVASTAPAAPAGVVAVSDVSEPTVNDAAGVAPKLTAVAPVKADPVIVTVVPPASGPAAGLTLLTVGPLVYVNRSRVDVADVPPAVVTVRSTVPALPAGAVAVIDVGESIVNALAAA
jgi:hypothetical protein